jgi:hypothetical protein
MRRFLGRFRIAVAAMVPAPECRFAAVRGAIPGSLQPAATRRIAIGAARTRRVASGFNTLARAACRHDSCAVVRRTDTPGAAMSKHTSTKLQVRAERGETRELEVFREARLCDAAPGHAEELRWARDAQGRWYSFSTFDARSLVESSSGDWFYILA